MAIREVRIMGDDILEKQRADARADCADWRTWSLSAWLAGRGGT